MPRYPPSFGSLDQLPCLPSTVLLFEDRLGEGTGNSSWIVAPPSSQTSPNVDGCAVQGPIGMPFKQFRIFKNVAAKSLDVATQKVHTKNV